MMHSCYTGCIECFVVEGFVILQWLFKAMPGCCLERALIKTIKTGKGAEAEVPPAHVPGAGHPLFVLRTFTPRIPCLYTGAAGTGVYGKEED